MSIIIPIGDSSMVNIDGTHQIFTYVNQFLKEWGKEPMFNIQLVGLNKEIQQGRGLFKVIPDAVYTEVPQSDIVIIPAIFGNPVEAFENNKELIPWILKQHAGGAEIVTYCVGAFFLAKTGLLDGKQAATHWTAATDFRNMFPQVDLVDDKILTAEDGVYTSGGAYSYLNLILYLIEKHVGRDMAILISKTFMIDIDKHSQSPFIIFQGQKTHEDESVKKAQEYIEQNYTEKISVNEIAERFALGRRSLERRFKKATSNTVSEYIHRVKVEAAKKSLELGKANVNEVMYDVGYSDTKAFRNMFKKITGLTPAEYKSRYQKELAVA